MVKIAPSILAADSANFGREISALQSAGADYIHFDVMDGHFVPNLTFGPKILKETKSYSKLPFDVHLMVTCPERFIPWYAEAGADIVCAAITSAVRLVETTVNDVLGLAASVKVRESDASISLRLPGSLGQTAESTCQALLTGMMVYFAQLHDEYPEHIEVLEDE